MNRRPKAYRAKLTSYVDAVRLQRIRSSMPEFNLSEAIDNYLSKLLDSPEHQSTRDYEELREEERALENEAARISAAITINREQQNAKLADPTGENEAQRLNTEHFRMQQLKDAAQNVEVKKSRTGNVEDHEFKDVYYEPEKIPGLIISGVIKGSPWRAHPPEGFEYTGRLNWLGRPIIKKIPGYEEVD